MTYTSHHDIELYTVYTLIKACVTKGKYYNFNRTVGPSQMRVGIVFLVVILMELT